MKVKELIKMMQEWSEWGYSDHDVVFRENKGPLSEINYAVYQDVEGKRVVVLAKEWF